MAKTKAAKKPHPHPIDKNPRLPRFGATPAQGRRNQRERELANQLASLRISYDDMIKQWEGERLEKRARIEQLERVCEEKYKIIEDQRDLIDKLEVEVAKLEGKDPDPVPMLLTCPSCSARHIDEGEFAVKPHHTHACQNCGMTWRPAIVPTKGVQFLPGFKNEVATGKSSAWQTPFWVAGLAGAAAYVGARAGKSTP